MKICLQDKIEDSIALIKKGEKLALLMQPNEIDDMITAYRGGNLLINIIGDDPKQTTLDL